MPAAVLDISALESWLWEAACIIRGPIDAPSSRTTSFRSSSSSASPTFTRTTSSASAPAPASLTRTTNSYASMSRPARAGLICSSRPPDSASCSPIAVRAVSRENPRLHGVIDIKDFNETAAGQRILSDDQLRALIQLLSQHRLGLKDVEPDSLGRAYEYLIRKFAKDRDKAPASSTPLAKLP